MSPRQGVMSAKLAFYAEKGVFAGRLLARQFRRSPTDDGVLRIIATHHKTGTFLMHQVFRGLSRRFGLRYFAGPQRDLPRSTEIWLQDQSQIDRRALARSYLGVHLVRHPYEVAASAYRYHLDCREKWCIDPSVASSLDGRRWSITGKSYQEHLRGLSPHAGLSFEIQGYTEGVLQGMLKWDYDDRRILECRLEDFDAGYEETFRRIFQHLELLGLGTDRLMAIAAAHDLRRAAPDAIAANPHVTNKQLRSSTYEEMFSPEHYRLLHDIFPPDRIERLGYASRFEHAHDKAAT